MKRLFVHLLFLMILVGTFTVVFFTGYGIGKISQNQCLSPYHLYVKGDDTSGFHVEGPNGEYAVLTNVLDIKCQPRDPELYKYAR